MLHLLRARRRPRSDHQAVFLEFALSLLCLIGMHRARMRDAPPTLPKHATRLRVVR